MAHARHRRLLIPEKPVWLFGRATRRTLDLMLRIWSAVLRGLNREAPSLAILVIYASAGAYGLMAWPPARAWLGLHRIVDVFLLAVFLLWLMMFLVWTHEQMQEKLLRWLPAVLVAPFWMPVFLGSLAILVPITVVLFAGSLAVMPFGVLAMLLGMLAARRRRQQGIILRCVKGSCRGGHTTFRDLEIRYICPGCATPYPYLTASHYGFLTHRCTCGWLLPAAASRRRRVDAAGLSQESRLVKECPNGHPWGAGSDLLPAHFIAIAGGVSAGKTCFLSMGVEELWRQLGDKPGASSRFFESSFDLDSHRERIRLLQAGRPLARTKAGVPEAIVLRLPRTSVGDSRVYLYDASGEEYSAVGRRAGREFEFFEDLSGIVFLVDPLYLPRLRDQDFRQPAETISVTPLEHIVASLRHDIARFLRYGPGGRSNVPVAVTVNKCDLGPIGERIGKVGVREALIGWGAANEVHALEGQFTEIQYFACSALGRTADGSGQAFRADGVIKPLEWLIKSEEQRRRKVRTAA